MSKLCPCTVGNSVAGALFNLKNAKKLNQQDQETVLTAVGTVLSRSVETSYSLTRSSSSWAYFVTFRLDDGSEVKLSTSEEGYGILKESLTGTVTYQGSLLMDFAEGCEGK